MISMHIGKQGIPIWFRCFEEKNCPDAFKEELIKEGISILRMKQNIKVFYFDRTVKITAIALVALNSFLKYFESMYCLSLSYITRSDFAKNTKCYKNVKISTHTSSNGKRIRILSLFNTWLTLFHLAFNSLNFVLYDS